MSLKDHELSCYILECYIAYNMDEQLLFLVQVIACVD